MSKIKVIYLMGMGRSGGTLLGRLIGQSPDSIYVGELRYLLQRGVVDNWDCSCGESFNSCEVWSKILSRWTKKFGGDTLGEKFYDDSLNRTRYFLPLFLSKVLGIVSGRLGRFLEKEQALYNVIADCLDKKNIVESSRYPGRALMISMLGNVDVYVVHLIRDARGVVNSQMKESRRNGESVSEFPMQRIFHWVVINMLSSFSKIAIGSDHYKQIRYEDFVENPEGVIGELGEFYKLDTVDKSKLSGNKIFLDPVHVFSGNENRFTDGEIEISPDNKWKLELSNKTKSIVTACTYVFMKFYGYRKIF